MPQVYGLGLLAFVLLLLIFNTIKVLREYERGVIFRLGRLVGARGPGLIILIPMVEKMIRVDLRTITYDIPPQDDQSQRGAVFPDCRRQQSDCIGGALF